MQGMSEREYAAHAGLSRGAIQKAKAAAAGAAPDGSIDGEASDARQAAATDPSKQRGRERLSNRRGIRQSWKPVPNAAVAAVGDTCGSTACRRLRAAARTFLQAKTANEVLKSQERRLKLHEAQRASWSTAPVPRRWSSASPARPATPG